MKAFVLAAGRGTRMKELTVDRPKHMIQVNGKPFIHHLLTRIKDAGIDEICVLVYYTKEKLIEYLSKEFPEVKTVEQAEPLGTGDAVKSAKNFAGGEDFLVIMGDNLYSPEDIKAVAEMKGNVIAGYSVEDPRRFGVLQINKDKLISIIEKSENPPSNMINTGLYKFDRRIFTEIDKLKKSPRGEYELTDALTSLAKTAGVAVYTLKDYWEDLGKPEDVDKMEKFLKNLE